LEGLVDQDKQGKGTRRERAERLRLRLIPGKSKRFDPFDFSLESGPGSRSHGLQRSSVCSIVSTWQHLSPSGPVEFKDIYEQKTGKKLVSAAGGM
jgi:hypothetical protein